MSSARKPAAGAAFLIGFGLTFAGGALGLVLGFAASDAVAQAGEGTRRRKCGRERELFEHSVRAGESLRRLAARYATTEADLLERNPALDGLHMVIGPEGEPHPERWL